MWFSRWVWHAKLLINDAWVLEKYASDKNKAFGALLIDLSKAFDCLCHDLLIGKLHAYGLDLSSLNLLQDYSPNRQQRAKVDSFLSSWEDILSGLPEGSILSCLLFNILFNIFNIENSLLYWLCR